MKEATILLWRFVLTVIIITIIINSYEITVTNCNIEIIGSSLAGLQRLLDDIAEYSCTCS